MFQKSVDIKNTYRYTH